METWRAIGIMSGTSLDGIDAVILEHQEDGRFAVAAHASQPFHAPLRAGLLALAEDQPQRTSETARLARALSESYVVAVESLLAGAGLSPGAIRVIGMHGQTIHHTPPPDGVTWQLGWPGWVAAKSGIPTAGDFRVVDAALGGQAAPLAPLAHTAFFGDSDERRVVLNIGGIANVTVLEAGGAVLRAFDTGPGNMVLDGVVQDASAGRTLFDPGGRIARSGRVSRRHLETLLADEYFGRAAPKSTGRERFGRAFRAPLRDLCVEDAAATAVAVTVETVRAAIREARPDRVIVAGGGARNTFLMESLKAVLPVPVEDSSRYGLAPEAVEGAVFAWLGDACLRRVRHDLGPITGGRPARLGVIAWPP